MDDGRRPVGRGDEELLCEPDGRRLREREGGAEGDDSELSMGSTDNHVRHGLSEHNGHSGDDGGAAVGRDG